MFQWSKIELENLWKALPRYQAKVCARADGRSLLKRSTNLNISLQIRWKYTLRRTPYPPEFLTSITN